MAKYFAQRQVLNTYVYLIHFLLTVFTPMTNSYNASDRHVLILGGYGNFGKYIAEALCKADIAIILAGRNVQTANEFKETLVHKYPKARIGTLAIDVNLSILNTLTQLNPFIVINTCGPFQLSNYHIIEECIEAGVHYIDLADARDFVCGVSTLNAKALAKNVLVVSGASSVPGLSSAVVEHFKSSFSSIDSLNYGIATVQRFSRGFATAKGLLTYIGKRCKPAAGGQKAFYGWQGLHRINYPLLGNRWMGFCDIPDLDLLPKEFNIKDIKFYAGMESSLLHLGMWLTSWLVRIGIPINLPAHTQSLLKVAGWFDWQTTDNSGMHLFMKGKDKANKPLEIKWFILAENAAGPRIPTTPAIILAKQLIHNEITIRGAMPCVNLIALDRYLEELKEFPITTQVWRSDDLPVA